MSECVVRMEMPKGCGGCLCANFGYCGITHEPVADAYMGYRENRPKTCPILAVLPEKHGRLVDADEIIEAIDEDIELDSRGLDDMTITGRVRERLRLDREYKKSFKEYLVKRPTIVPATEGGKHDHR